MVNALKYKSSSLKVYLDMFKLDGEMSCAYEPFSGLCKQIPGFSLEDLKLILGPKRANL